MATTTSTNPTTSLNNWQWWQNHVQSDLQGGEFVNAATTLIAAGPPRLPSGTQNIGSLNNLAFPIGIVENFGLNQNKMIQKMFEIGSKRAYHIPGRTVGAITLGRILYWGPSLLRVLYAYYPSNKINGGQGAYPVDSIGLGGSPTPPEVKDSPGYGAAPSANSGNTDFFINLASDLFDHPLGLLVYLRDAQDDCYGAMYLEDVYLQAHSLNCNASSILIAEGCSAQYDRLVPINVPAGTNRG